ncbi:hypothetical protein [Muricoccus aerilatus]|uniref:hypothetical protein n=1 Tax=Muricoccus aerilatus TaxID=452982 RepID=UPI0005C209FB|nr:hypothetical protein [Roseomonas aerilata]
MHDFTLPEETAARLFALSDNHAEIVGGYPFAVVVAPLPRTRATPAEFFGSLAQPSGFSVVLTHSLGVNWTDVTGEKLLVSAIERDGIALLAYETQEDAEQGLRLAWRAIAPWTGQMAKPSLEEGANGPDGGAA